MTIRPRAARTLREVRTRMRDAAAASHATALAAREHTRAALAQEHAQLAAYLEQAPDVLASARAVHDLDRIAEIAGAYRLAIDDASRHHDEALAATTRTASSLRERARQLRSAEAIIEKLDREAERHENRAEQRSQDDLAARRR